MQRLEAIQSTDSDRNPAGSRPAPAPRFDKANVQAILQATPLQEALLLGCLHDPTRDPGFLQVRSRFTGPMHLPDFEEAWRTAFERHDALRMSVRQLENTRPLFIIWKSVTPKVEFRDVTHHTPQEQGELMDDFRRQDHAAGLNLSQPPTSRIAVFRLRPLEFEVIWTCHHALLDGWSSALVLDEVLGVHNSLRRGETPALPPAPGLRGYHQWLTEQDAGAADAFWRGKIGSFIEPTPLPVPLSAPDGISIETQTAPTGNAEIVLDETMVTAIAKKARACQATPNAVMLAAWGLLLARRCRRRDVLFGTVVSGRPSSMPGAESLVGMFANALPIRLRHDRVATAFDAIRQAQREQHDALEFQHVPPGQIQHRCTRVPGRMRLFQSLLVFENFAGATDAQAHTAEMRRRETTSGITSNYPLTVAISPGSSWRIQCIIHPPAPDASVATRLLGDLRECLEVLTVDSESRFTSFLADATSPSNIPESILESLPRPGPSVDPDRADAVSGETLRRLIPIFERVLGVSALTPDANFFDLGGYSLLAVLLVTEIEREFPVRLRAAALIEAPTIRALADRIDRYRTNAAEKSAAPRIDTFVFMPSATGDLLYHLPLTFGHDGRFQVAGEMRACKLDVQYEAGTRLERIADRYIREIRRIQPRGPVHLAARQCDAWLNYEVAQQLHRSDGQVAFLGIVDHPPPGLSVATPRVANRYLDTVRGHLRRREFGKLGARAVVTAYIRARTFWNRLRRRKTRYLSRGKPFVYADAIAAYSARVYPGRITLFISDAFERSRFGKNCIPRWTDLAGGGLDVVRIPGSMHPNIFEEPNVKYLRDSLTSQKNNGHEQEREHE